jgi:hypothetical protein
MWMIYTQHQESNPPPLSCFSPLKSVPLSLNAYRPVSITADIIRQDSGRRDLYLYVDGGLVDRTLTYSPDTQWIDAHEVWSGILSNGSHTVTIKSPDSVRFGCGAEWGAIETIIFD